MRTIHMRLTGMTHGVVFHLAGLSRSGEKRRAGQKRQRTNGKHYRILRYTMGADPPPAAEE
jgi:hypothetical protein